MAYPAGTLVQIQNIPVRLTPLSGSTASASHVEPVDVSGTPGRVIVQNIDYCIVQTFDGLHFDIPTSSLTPWEPQSAEDGGFDLCWPTEEDGDMGQNAFAEAMVGVLATKGYCIVQMFTSAKDREAAIDETYEMSQWLLPKKELEAAYMGQDSTDKYAMLPTDNPDFEPEDMLSSCDRSITNIGLALDGITQRVLGFGCWGKLNSMVRIPLTSQNEELQLRPKPIAQQDYEDGRVIGHLNFLLRRKLFIMFLLENDGGTLRLFNRGDPVESAVHIPLTKNKMLVLRHDLMGYAYKPRGFALALQSFLMTDPPAEDPEEGGVVSLPLQLHGDRAHVMSFTNRYPGDSLGPTCYWSLLCGGGDSLTKVPTCRWNVDEYYSEERSGAGTTYAMHGGFCSDACVVMFDNEFFSISSEEAERMSPGQRVVLETGFETLHRAGHTKATTQGFSCGVFLGDSGNDWPYMCQAQDAFRILSQSNFITGARLSHALALRGPVSTADTACSSSLVAVCLAHTSMRRAGADQRKATINSDCRVGVALGSGLLLSPRMYILYCGPGMLSPRGRCFTYDGSADGYARGEGCGGLLIECSNRDEEVQGMLACLIGSAVNQDGRSASMTAPNGPAQQTCIRTSMSESGLVASEITVAECHGTGTALGDPIEVSALRAVMDERGVPILNTSAKTNIGHLEAAAGMAGLIKCILLLVASSGPPNVHLNMLNPHMDVNGYPVYFETELCDYLCDTGVSGVSSFGFGGTNARGDLWGRCLRGARTTSAVNTATWLEKRSMFYQRVFHYGNPGPHDSDRVCIIGTWDAYSSMVEMDRIAQGTYGVMVVIGETRQEQFHFLINSDRSQAIHPDQGRAGRDARVEGPDGDGTGKSWLIDGQSDQVPAWTIYQVKLDWGFSWEHGEYKKVTWEATDQVALAKTRVLLHRHTYSVVGSWTSWTFHEMSRSKEEEGLWTSTVRIGMSGCEEFQFVRDNDWSQTIHPASAAARRTSIPIHGPDAAGAGKNWLITGDVGDMVRIQLWVLDGEIRVTIASETHGVKTWQSMEEESWMQYYITGTWNNWGFSPMTRDSDNKHVHRCVLKMSKLGFEEFHMVVEKDWSLQLYPDYERAAQGEAIMCGPDGDGHGLNWMISGSPGCRYEIKLDMVEQDQSLSVTWRKLGRVALREE